KWSELGAGSEKKVPLTMKTDLILAVIAGLSMIFYLGIMIWNVPHIDLIIVVVIVLVMMVYDMWYEATTSGRQGGSCGLSPGGWPDTSTAGLICLRATRISPFPSARDDPPV